MATTLKDFIAIVLFGGFCFLVTPSYGSECADNNFDYFKIAKALSQGVSKQDLLSHLEASKHELAEERIEKILKLIDEVFKLDPEQAEGWWRAHYKECPKEDEA